MALGRNAPDWVKAAVRGAFRAVGYRLQPIEHAFEELQRRLLRECDLLVDGGANVGQYVRAARSLGYRGPIVSFEPQAAAFAALQCAASGVGGWQVRQVALADTEGEAELRVTANSVSSSLLDVRTECVAALPSAAEIAREPVTTSTLDKQLAGEPGRALWLKLDLQGGELDALRGGDETLARTAVVECEVSLRPLYERQTDYVDLINHLRRAGFTLCHVRPNFYDRRSCQVLQFDAIFTRLCPSTAGGQSLPTAAGAEPPAETGSVGATG